MKRSFQFLLPYLHRYRRGFTLGFGALAAKAILGAALPLAIRGGIDALTGGRGLKTVAGFCALLILVSICKGLFQYWMRVILIGISRDIEYDLRNDLFSKLVTLDAEFYGRMRTGDILARATNDMNAVRMMLGPGVMYWFETSLTLVLSVTVMSMVDWRLALVALIPAPLVTIAVLGFGRRIHARFNAIQEMFSTISSRVQENLMGVRVVRAYVQEQAELRHFEQVNREYIGENLRLAKISGLFNALLQALVGISFLLVLWMGGVQLSRHRITVGSFVMFYTYLGMLVWPMIAMGWVANLMERGRASLERVRELLDQRPRIAVPANPRPLTSPVRGEIVFHGVGVRYGDRAALEGVDLWVPAGATVAIVGHTGSGKSTLAHLIPRLLDPSSGAVTLDQVDLRELDPQDLRRVIGYVPQETFLFSATLAENIAFGVSDATEGQIRRAAEIAGLGPDVDGFPNGYATIVGERGITLSGGQKQRTAIARAILRDPRILILDDALASVDTATEERILTELSSVMRGRTTILISHRVSTVRHADRIFVLEHGEVVAEGSHAELLQGGGYYADLYQKQLLEEELEAI
ncbi:MAG TPA: ABC transporter ATP-binding protein [Bryobacteraceae bacterium]|nr:ABC transporter ATP-binding protein [Bryobacteraceae bacterium]